MNEERFKEVVREQLFQTHQCPKEFADEMLERYDNVVRGCIAPIDVIRWFYLEWKDRGGKQ